MGLFDSMGAARLTPATDEASPDAAPATRRYIRGSGLLLAGRLISVGLNFLVQVLTVRYLTKEDYGAFAYALGVAALGANVVLLGLAKTIPRLVPIYRERKDEARAFGSIVVAIGTIGGLGLLLVAALFLGQAFVAEHARLGPKSISLLVILIAMAPTDAFDNLLQQLASVFCSARTIFVRRHVVGPGLRLVAVAAAVAGGGDVQTLALGYVAGGLVGVSLYMVVLARTWRRQGLLQYLRPGRVVLPVREVFGFAIPLLSTEVSLALRGSVVLIMLEYFRGTESVAAFRAVLSVASLNTIVFDAFAFMFVPLASRMYAREDFGGIGHLYWVTSLWIAILTMPIFVITCLMAPTITVVLFGERYADAAVLLAILSVGYYLNSALGFNATTLRVHGRLRLIVIGDVVTSVFAIVGGIVLINMFGAVGAAVGTTLTLVLQNVVSHVGLWLGRTGIRLFAWSYVRIYLLIAVLTTSIALCQWLLGPPAPVVAAMGGALCLVVIRASRHSLDPRTVCPELLQIPLLRHLLA